MGKMQKGARPSASARGSSPKGGMQPQQKPAKPMGPAKVKKISRGTPTSGSGADTNPWSSARKGR